MQHIVTVALLTNESLDDLNDKVADAAKRKEDIHKSVTLLYELSDLAKQLGDALLKEEEDCKSICYIGAYLRKSMSQVQEELEVIDTQEKKVIAAELRTIGNEQTSIDRNQRQLKKDLEKVMMRKVLEGLDLNVEEEETSRPTKLSEKEGKVSSFFEKLKGSDDEVRKCKTGIEVPERPHGRSRSKDRDSLKLRGRSKSREKETQAPASEESVLRRSGRSKDRDSLKLRTRSKSREKDPNSPLSEDELMRQASNESLRNSRLLPKGMLRENKSEVSLNSTPTTSPPNHFRGSDSPRVASPSTSHPSTPNPSPTHQHRHLKGLSQSMNYSSSTSSEVLFIRSPSNLRSKPFSLVVEPEELKDEPSAHPEESHEESKIIENISKLDADFAKLAGRLEKVQECADEVEKKLVHTKEQYKFLQEKYHALVDEHPMEDRLLVTSSQIDKIKQNLVRFLTLTKKTSDSGTNSQGAGGGDEISELEASSESECSINLSEYKFILASPVVKSPVVTTAPRPFPPFTTSYEGPVDPTASSESLIANPRGLRTSPLSSSLPVSMLKPKQKTVRTPPAPILGFLFW